MVSLSWTVRPQDARRDLPTKVLQGNLDPVVLYGDRIEDEVRALARIALLGSCGVCTFFLSFGTPLFPGKSEWVVAEKKSPSSLGAMRETTRPRLQD